MGPETKNILQKHKNTMQKQRISCKNKEYPAKTKREGVLISFLDSLINFDESAMVSEMEVFNTVSVCLAAEQAVKTGKIVDIDYL